VAQRFETGTLSHEALAGFTAAVEYVRSVGYDAIQAHERALGNRFLDGLARTYRLHGPRTMEGRVPTFALTHPRRSPDEVAAELAQRGFAVWPGNYYAVEIMEHLGLPDGAVRVGLVHYNTFDEVHRLLDALEGL
jgi:selenocysteine lyase/cysteine desulfurase